MTTHLLRNRSENTLSMITIEKSIRYSLLLMFCFMHLLEENFDYRGLSLWANLVDGYVFGVSIDGCAPETT